MPSPNSEKVMKRRACLGDATDDPLSAVRLGPHSDVDCTATNAGQDKRNIRTKTRAWR